MLVFMDESGDAGFKLAKGSSPRFAIGMVIFRDGDAARDVSTIIRNAQKTLRVSPEFKFAKCRDDVRDAFFQLVRGRDFLIRAVVIEKKVETAPPRLKGMRAFYGQASLDCITRCSEDLQNAKVVIDGSGDRTFRNEMAARLRSSVPKGLIKDVSFRDSRSDPLLQLADMCIGAIARSYRSDRAEPDRWRAMIANRIEYVVEV